MDVDFASLHKVLKDPTRRDIVLYLNKKGQLTYTELMNLLEVTNTGKLNYHLRILNDLIQKGEDGKYSLTERGQLASQLLQKFPEKTVELNHLRVADAMLIGIVGFLLLFAFPLVFLAAGLLTAPFLTSVYELLLPGAVMWWLTTRHAKSHDFYDLLQPPIVPLALIVVALIVMVVARISFLITFTAPSSSANQTQIAMMGGFGFIILGFLPFIGVIITESLYRLSKRF